MSAELERLAKIDCPRLASVFAKAIDAGHIHVDELRRLLKLRAREYRRDGELPEQAYSKAFTGLNPRDTVGAELFAKLVTLDAAANGSHGHTFIAPGDTGDRVARDGIQGGPEGDARLQEIADAQRRFRLAVDKIGPTAA